MISSRKKTRRVKSRCQLKEATSIDIDWMVLHTILVVKPHRKTRNVALYAGLASYPYVSPKGDEFWQCVLFLKNWHKFKGVGEKYAWRCWRIKHLCSGELNNYLNDRFDKEPKCTLYKYKFMRDLAYSSKEDACQCKTVIAMGDGDITINEVVEGEYRFFTPTIYSRRFEYHVTEGDNIDQKLPMWKTKQHLKLPYTLERRMEHNFTWDIDYAKPNQPKPDWDEPDCD